MKTKWLSRYIAAPGPFLCICTSEKEFKEAFKHIKVTPPENWISSSHADATVHTCDIEDNFAAIVCIRELTKETKRGIYGLIIHESVHIWQKWCEYYGEHNPGDEQEAYAIQSLSQILMTEIDERLDKTP
jgi:hypothetical protein